MHVCEFSNEAMVSWDMSGFSGRNYKFYVQPLLPLTVPDFHEYDL